ncbi:hemolysin XhlA family protein [Weizmannia coagulans]|uniref:Uncharacterized protein n=2 Tax=Heyndrickxia TaxID=2837504 RepID=A0AAN0TAG1_HEYCO|nr:MULTISPECIES: hemolysin XhlA family protein [Heyndrickxia]AJO24775.1 hypothetical protein SB48_HM08orf06304 [Heyndrickxia coagulans]AKN53781.1 hypothetical protein AB434_1376 [Heyndrickxia coagulans]KGB30146.1 hypothetical protein IE89_06465 [Heyndrickxia coagulans]KXT21134.1 hypothetical protein UZ35_06100 [Heyndrickxia coagulans]MCR4445388.1 hemolysin XhlA family protein [Heyndrickxia coagulans]
MEAEKVDIWKETIQKDIDAIKSEQNNMKLDQERIKADISELKTNDKLQDQQISNIRDDLKEIKGDTKWLRHTITAAIIVAFISGAVAIFYAAIQ